MFEPEALGKAVHAAEHLVEHAVVAAERSLARRLGLRGLRIVLLGLRAAWIIAVLAYFLFGFAVLVTRYYLLPHIDDWRTRIETAAGGALHAPVAIGHIEADWQGLNPRLLLSDVVLKDRDGGTALALPQVDVVLSWTTLLAWQPRMHSMTIQSPELAVKRLADRRYAIAGIVIDPQAAQSDTSFVDWVLAQHHISVRNAIVHFVDEAAVAPAPAETSATPPELAEKGGAASAAAPPGPPQPAQALDFTDVNFILARGLTGHSFAVQLRPPPQLAGLVDIRGEFAHPWTEPTARMTSWSGRVFAEFDYADLARINSLTGLVPEPARIERAAGAVRAWIDFSALNITRLRADVALTDVAAQLRPDLQPLRFDRLQGRITQSAWTDGDGDSREVVLTGVQLDGPDKLHLPPTDLLFRNTRAARAGASAPRETSRLEASRLVLSDWSRLAAQLPLPPEWLALIDRVAARGTLEDLRATWNGPDTPPTAYSLRARFSDLGFSFDPAASRSEAEAESPRAAPGSADVHEEGEPGAKYEFENLAGIVEFDQDAGSLRIDANKAHVRIPQLAAVAPIALDTLATRVRWSRDTDSKHTFTVDSFAAANPDMDVSASGSYHEAGAEPARLDVSGRMARLRVPAVANYLPTVTPEATRAWLRGGLLAGNAIDGSFFVHGDPRAFPFADPKAGEFHFGIHVQDGTLDIDPAAREAAARAVEPGAPGAAQLRPHHPVPWPLLEGIDADVIFDHNHLVINGRRARAFGYDLTNISARIAQLDQPDQHLAIDGQGSGPLPELLRYVASSPVDAWTGGWIGAATSSGTTRLRLKLDIPLAHAADSGVLGAVTFRGNNLELSPDVAPFSGLTGELDFNQKGIRLAGVSGGFLGGDVRISGDTHPDGTIEIQGAGTATPQGAKRQVSPASLRHLLDHTRGTFRYSAAVTVHNGAIGVKVDSDLVGMAADLPEPFRKAAAETKPLHIEILPVAGADPARDTLRASLGNNVMAELHRVAGPDGATRVERGVIGVGAQATPPDSGMLLLVDQPNVDVDRWQTLLGINALSQAAAAPAPVPAVPAAPAGTDAGTADTEQIDIVAVHANELTFFGKTANNVSLTAKRDADQGWSADVDSDQASGSMHWTAARPGAPGRLTARLAKLTIPESDQKQVTELLDAPPTEFPALDIIAEQFQLGAINLGHLEVEAQNTGAGRVDSWNLQKLTLINPDGKLVGSGVWQREGSTNARKMAIKLSLAFSNAGDLLTRFGYPGLIRNGSGKIEGDLTWRGAPFAIDYPSLAGHLHFASEKGQFLKAGPNAAGRLLGVMSLQGLANRATGDFRDVFSAGFAFDSITADAAIANGTLTTDDFIMKGVNAVVRIKGDVDLHAETQNLEVVMIPEVNVQAAALAGLLVNPAVAVSVFIGNFVLGKPLSAALTRVYKVTGPWSDPQVERVQTNQPPPGDQGTP